MLREISQLRYTCRKELELKELIRTASLSTDIDDFTRQVLPAFTRITEYLWVALYIADPRLATPSYYHYGLSPEIALYMERSCAIEFNSYLNYPDFQNSIPAVSIPQTSDNILYYPLFYNGIFTGLLQTELNINLANERLCEQCLVSITNIVKRLIDQAIDSKSR